GCLRFCALVLSILALTANRTSAQVNTVNLSGTVLDPQGLAVGGATVTLANSGTGVLRSVTSDSSGRYELVGNPPGTYTLTVDAPGFATLKNESLTLTIGTAAEYNAQLQVQSAAPTSGLNFGGQRARSNEVSVDGADAVDNSTNGVRATVSQEAVQEFQVITSNYMPEYGRAMGGVVNIVTK